MRTPTMIVIGGAVALAVAWLLLTRTPAPPAHTQAPVVVASPAPAQTPPIETATAPTATPAPEPAAANVPPPEPPASTAPAAQPPGVDETQKATTDEQAETDAPADDVAAEDDAAPDDTAGPQPINAEDAADHMADWIASQENEAADDQEKGDHVLETFDGESTDAAWSEPTEKQIEAVLNQWLDGLPAEIRAHIALLSVECRITVCLILAADNDIASQDEREKSGQEWQQAIATLPQQPWWHELGFVDLTTAVSASGTTGYLLYQSFLLRQAPPATE